MFLSAAPAPTAPPLRHASGARTVLRRAVPVASDDDEPLRMFLSAAPAPTAPLMRHIVILVLALFLYWLSSLHQMRKSQAPLDLSLLPLKMSFRFPDFSLSITRHFKTERCRINSTFILPAGGSLKFF